MMAASRTMVWTQTHPRLSDLGCKPGQQREAAREVALLIGDTDLNRDRISYLIECLAECEKPEPNPAMVSALSKINRRTAFRLFAFLPHPALPPIPRDTRPTVAHLQSREMYEGAGYWLLAKDMDLKIMRRWLNKNYKSFEKFALLALARYEVIGALFQYGYLESTFSIPSLWLLSEYKRAKARLANQTEPRSIYQIVKANRGEIERLEEMVNQGLGSSDDLDLPFAALDRLEEFAANVAISHPDFDRDYFKPMMRRLKSWNNSTRDKLSIPNPPPSRGPSLGNGNCYRM